APARAPFGPPFTPWAADARRHPPALPQIPAAQRSRGLQRAAEVARPAPVSVIEAGTPVPEFSLATADGEKFTREDLLGKPLGFGFYPVAFSPVCHSQP